MTRGAPPRGAGAEAEAAADNDGGDWGPQWGVELGGPQFGRAFKAWGSSQGGPEMVVVFVVHAARPPARSFASPVTYFHGINPGFGTLAAHTHTHRRRRRRRI